MYEKINKSLEEARKGSVDTKETLLNSLNPLLISLIRTYYYKPIEFDDLLQER